MGGGKVPSFYHLRLDFSGQTSFVTIHNQLVKQYCPHITGLLHSGGEWIPPKLYIQRAGGVDLLSLSAVSFVCMCLPRVYKPFSTLGEAEA